MTARKPVELSAIEIIATEPMRLASFWSELVGVPVNPGSTDAGASLMASDRIPPLAFVRTDEPKIWRNRVALRLVTEDFDAHLTRLLEMKVAFLGASRLGSGEGTVQFLDPEGNEFTLVQRRRLP